jgi:3-methyladenine DNA glycosylase Tag
MSKKKIMIVVVASLTLIALLIISIPVFAADNSSPTNPAQITPANKVKILVRLLLVQDEAKVDAFIAKAVAVGKLNTDQASKLKEFWTTHHKQFARNFILKRLISAKDEAKVKACLDNAVKSGKIQQAQEDKILQIWEILHTPAPAASSAQ